MTEAEAKTLMAQAAGIDASTAEEQAAASQIAPPAGGMNPDDAKAMEWIIIPEMLAMLFTSMFPETEPMYTPEAQMRLAQKFVPVAEKRGWTGTSSVPEIGLALGGIVFAMPAVMAYKIRKAQLEQAERDGKDKHLGAGNDGNR